MKTSLVTFVLLAKMKYDRLNNCSIMCAMENDGFCKFVCNDGWLIVQLKMTNCKTEKKNEKNKEEKKKKREGPQLE